MRFLRNKDFFRSGSTIQVHIDQFPNVFMPSMMIVKAQWFAMSSDLEKSATEKVLRRIQRPLQGYLI